MRRSVGGESGVMASPVESPVPVSIRELEAAASHAMQGVNQLDDALRWAAKGRRLAGPEGDEVRATVLALAALADAALYEARVTLDGMLRAAAVDGVCAPRQAIVLPG